MIKKDRLLKLIEPHFIKDLVHNDYKIKTIKAKNLLTHNRFDIAFKLLYLELREKSALPSSIQKIRDNYTSGILVVGKKKF